MNADKARNLFCTLLSSKKNLRVKLLGDSITHGAGGTGWKQEGEVIVEGWAKSPNSFCWANSFRDYMKEKYGATVINNACTGTNVGFIMEHFSALVDPEDDIIICTIGTNNRHLYFEKGEKPSKEEFYDALLESIKNLYRMFLENGTPVIMVANIPAAKENEKDGENYWRILHMDDINRAYKALSSDSGATVISLYDRMLDYCEREGISHETLLHDGLHPNDDGYRVMYSLLKDALGV